MGRIPNAHPAPRALHGGMSITRDTGALQKRPGQLWCVTVLGESICLLFPHLWDPLPEGQARKKGFLPKGWQEEHFK